MIRERDRGLKTSADLEGIIGLQEIGSLDELKRIYQEATPEPTISCAMVGQVIGRELASKDLSSLLTSLPKRIFDNLDIKDIASLLQKLPKQLYFFLWQMHNSEQLPLEGMISSQDLKKALYYLTKFLIFLEMFVKRAPNSLPIYENLAFTHIDLAGIVRYARNGLIINRRQLQHTQLLRKAVSCFQIAIKLEAYHGKSIDTSHQDVMSLLDEDCRFKGNRMFLYLNPWYFLYIAGVLHWLNDRETGRLYLEKARLILNNLADHQNPKIRAQQDLLESVFSTVKHGDSVQFDFDRKKLARLKKRIRLIKKCKRTPGVRRAYSPFVEEALTQQYQTQYSFLKRGSLSPEQLGYLQGIFTLYDEVKSAFERDRLIYRLNIKPLRANGARPVLKKIAPRLASKKPPQLKAGRSA